MSDLGMHKLKVIVAGQVRRGKEVWRGCCDLKRSWAVEAGILKCRQVGATKGLEALAGHGVE